MIVLLLIAGIGIFACGAAVVLLMLVYLLLFKIGCIVVFCLLPFGAFEKTAWVVERPIGWVMSNGIRFLVLALVVGLLFRFADQATAQTLNVADGTWTDLGNATAVALQLLLVNLLMLVFIVMANRFAGEIAGGAASLSLGDFTNRVAGGGTSEPIVRAAGGATNSAIRHAAVGTGLGVIAAGAAIGAVWSKSKQKINLGGGGNSSGGGAAGGGAAGSAKATATAPIAAMVRPIPVAVRRVPNPPTPRPPPPPGQPQFVP